MLRFPIPKFRRIVREKRRRVFHRSPLDRAKPTKISVLGSCLPTLPVLNSVVDKDGGILQKFLTLLSRKPLPTFRINKEAKILHLKDPQKHLY
jgi:hypothetical protein